MQDLILFARDTSTLKEALAFSGVWLYIVYMTTKTTVKTTTQRETINFTEEEIIAVIAQHYGLKMSGRDAYETETEVSHSGILRGIKFYRTVETEPEETETEI